MDTISNIGPYEGVVTCETRLEQASGCARMTDLVAGLVFPEPVRFIMRN